MLLFFYQDNISMEFPICRLTVKELREIAKKMGLAHKGLKKCQLILLLERNGANQQEPEEFEPTEFEFVEPEEFEPTEFEFERKPTKRLQFGDTKRAIISDSDFTETKGRKSRGTKTTRTLSEEDLKNFVPRRVLKKQAKKNEFFELEEAMPSQSIYSKKPIDIKRNWKTNYKVGKYLPMLEVESEKPSKKQAEKLEDFKDTNDPYELLGVSKNSSFSEIKSAYKKKSLIYHPDRLSNKSKAEQEKGKVIFQKINNAYQYLLENEQYRFEDEEREQMMAEIIRRDKERNEISKRKMEELKKDERFQQIFKKLASMTKKELLDLAFKIYDDRNIEKPKIKNYPQMTLMRLILKLEGFDVDFMGRAELEEFRIMMSKVKKVRKPKTKKSVPVPVQEESDELEFTDVIFEKESKPKKSKPAPIIEYTEDEMEDLQNTINILLDSPKEELNQIILEETGQDASNLTEEQIIKKILIDVQGHPANIVNKMKIRLKKSIGTHGSSKTSFDESGTRRVENPRKSTLVNIQIINEKDYRKMMNKPLSATIQRAYEEMLTNKQFDKSNEIQEYVAEKLKEEGIIKYV
jgi:curved DNA-binding protein CbpA